MKRRRARALPGSLASRANEQSSAMGSASAHAASLAAGAGAATTGCTPEPEAPPDQPCSGPVIVASQVASLACDSHSWKRWSVGRRRFVSPRGCAVRRVRTKTREEGRATRGGRERTVWPVDCAWAMANRFPGALAATLAIRARRSRRSACSRARRSAIVSGGALSPNACTARQDERSLS
jgi:hypothetical protein